MRNIIKFMENNKNEMEQVFRNNIGWENLSNFLGQSPPSKIFLITDHNTESLCLPYFREKMDGLSEFQIISIEPGEIHKNIDSCVGIWNTLSELGADRNSLIINIGGGVITDLGGFISSTFNRGLPFINIPTSLLAMVDASVGGKNGIDLGHLKNKIGLINLPKMVIIDKEFLKTLPQEHIVSGYAEMLKHGLIFSKNYWERVKNCDLSITQNFEELIWESIEIKNEIVAQDPTELNIRKTLNYGHTLGHAIESYFLQCDSEKTLLHGEAVAAGIILATYISSESCGFPKQTVAEVSKVIFNYFEKISFLQNEIEAILKLLIFDKKNKNGQVLFVLLEEIGRPKMDCKVSNDLIYNAFSYYKNF